MSTFVNINLLIIVKISDDFTTIDVQSKLVPILDKHVNRIQDDYRVEILSWSNDPASTSDTKVKYNVTGYKNCVQEAITEVYQILTSPKEIHFKYVLIEIKFTWGIVCCIR